MATTAAAATITITITTLEKMKKIIMTNVTFLLCSTACEAWHVFTSDRLPCGAAQGTTGSTPPPSLSRYVARSPLWVTAVYVCARRPLWSLPPVPPPPPHTTHVTCHTWAHITQSGGSHGADAILIGEAMDERTPPLPQVCLVDCFSSGGSVISRYCRGNKVRPCHGP